MPCIVTDSAHKRLSYVMFPKASKKKDGNFPTQEQLLISSKIEFFEFIWICGMLCFWVECSAFNVFTRMKKGVAALVMRMLFFTFYCIIFSARSGEISNSTYTCAKGNWLKL